MRTLIAITFSLFCLSGSAQNTENTSKDSCTITVPNNLTVNSEARADMSVRSNCDLKDLKLSIYDRWGNKIYGTEIFDEEGYVDWKWKALKDPGTYYWVVTYKKKITGKEEEQSLTGFVTIIK